MVLQNIKKVLDYIDSESVKEDILSYLGSKFGEIRKNVITLTLRYPKIDIIPTLKMVIFCEMIKVHQTLTFDEKIYQNYIIN